jgi:L-threonylcarbamoyladenylate synthase
MDEIEKAVRIMMHDGIVVYPTDTIYGLGADALSDDAILKVYEAKGRPLSKPISIAVSDLEMLCTVARVDEEATAFLERFLPGPVTVILRARTCLPEILTGGTHQIGVRIPAHEIPLQIINRLDAPITATSANQSGGKEPTTPEECHVPYDFLIDGGRLPGIPSTVVDLVNGSILRKGRNSGEIEAYLSMFR